MTGAYASMADQKTVAEIIEQAIHHAHPAHPFAWDIAFDVLDALEKRGWRPADGMPDVDTEAVRADREAGGYEDRVYEPQPTERGAGKPWCDFCGDERVVNQIEPGKPPVPCPVCSRSADPESTRDDRAEGTL